MIERDLSFVSSGLDFLQSRNLRASLILNLNYLEGCRMMAEAKRFPYHRLFR